MFQTGAYTAERAAALSGVPRSTLQRWACNDVLVPSVSAHRTKLWSYGDLLAVRVIYWLWQRKSLGSEVPPTGIDTVRRALAQLRKISVPGRSLLIDSNGQLTFKIARGAQEPDLLDPVAPFVTREGSCGPDLIRPRPTLSIVPGKLAGSPHVAHTRIATRGIAALRSDGLTLHAIRKLYPYLKDSQIADALELEDQLAKNMGYPVPVGESSSRLS
jgi:uncharacterized protein (DUF433 family)